MLNCKISKNIAKTCDMSIGGIYDVVYLFHISDVDSLVFANDTRYDKGKRVSTINSSSAFYTWNISDGEYTEEQSSDEYTHTLTFNLHSLTPIEDILSDASNDKFLVAFRLKSETSYRLIGWRQGAELTYNLNVSDEGNYYTVTLADSSVYPSFECEASNFNLGSKVFDIVYRPYDTISTCEVYTDGTLSGYRLISYVTAQNTAGEPLDRDGKLTQYSGNKQAAYKLSSVSDSDYDIVGTYTKTDIVNGYAVRVYDPSHCTVTGSGTITVSPSELTFLASSNTSTNINITTSDSWYVVNNSPFLNLSTDSGYGNGAVICTWNGKRDASEGTVIAHNSNTNEEVTVNTKLYGIWISGTDSVAYDAKYIRLQYEYIGGDIIPTLEVTCNSTNVNYTAAFTKNGYILITFNYIEESGSNATFTVKLTHGTKTTEIATHTIEIIGNAKLPIWTTTLQYCEINSDGQRTGYKIVKQRDSNPKSTTYGIERQNRVASDDCKAEGEKWETLMEYCQTDANYKNTGVKITLQVQTVEGYASYGQTREMETTDTTFCPLESTDPDWATVSHVCLTDAYGQTGEKQMTQQDVNPYSSTYGSERIVTETDTDKCPPNTKAAWGLLQSWCLVDSNNQNTGYLNKFYVDQNPRSATYKETKEEAVYDATTCPISTTPNWVTESSVCETDTDGYNTGNVILTQRDTNSASSTYNTTRTITETDTEKCPLPSTDPQWETTSYTCTLDADGNNTGECVKTQTDQNKKSATYGQTKEVTETDETLCPVTTAEWKVTSTVCETDTYGQTGNKITTYTDVNTKSATYGKTKTETTADTTTCVPNTDPYWVTESSECETTEA